MGFGGVWVDYGAFGFRVSWFGCSAVEVKAGLLLAFEAHFGAESYTAQHLLSVAHFFLQRCLIESSCCRQLSHSKTSRSHSLANMLLRVVSACKASAPNPKQVFKLHARASRSKLILHLQAMKATNSFRTWTPRLGSTENGTTLVRVSARGACRSGYGF